MYSTISTSNSNRQMVWKLTIKLAIVLAGVSAMVVGSNITIPLSPVPITMQTVAVLLLGLCCTTGAAVTAVLAWIILGIAGLPVFANFASGIGVLLGARGGYIVGFLLAVFVMTKARELWRARFGAENSILALFAIGLLGQAMIYVIALPHLAVVLGSFRSAVMLGFLPFIVPGIVKTIILSALLRTVGLLKQATQNNGAQES